VTGLLRAYNGDAAAGEGSLVRTRTGLWDYPVHSGHTDFPWSCGNAAGPVAVP
jgi:hypothetical protein